jgi:hypothetical protein
MRSRRTHQAEYLTNLASKLRSRTIRYGIVADIDDALLYIRQAFDLRTTVPRIISPPSRISLNIVLRTSQLPFPANAAGSSWVEHRVIVVLSLHFAHLETYL